METIQRKKFVKIYEGNATGYPQSCQQSGKPTKRDLSPTKTKSTSEEDGKTLILLYETSAVINLLTSNTTRKDAKEQAQKEHAEDTANYPRLVNRRRLSLAGELL